MKIRVTGFLLVVVLVAFGPRDIRAQDKAGATPTPEAASEQPAAEESAKVSTDAVPTEEPKTDAEPAVTDESVAEPTPAADEAAAPEPADATADQPADAVPADAPSPVEEGSATATSSESDLPMPTEEGLGEPIDQETLPTADGSDLPNPDNLLPEDVYSGPDETAPPPPQIKENKFEQDRRMAVRYQEVKLQALKDQSIRDMRAKADEAKTDEGKRQALREYYKMLFTKMVSIAPELEEKCNTMEAAYMRRVGQYRVMPTIPLQPPPTPEPLPGRVEASKPADSGSEDNG